MGLIRWEYPPNQTGHNHNRLELLLVSGNTQDSVAGVDIDAYVTVKTNSAMTHPNPIYDTGVWGLSTTELLASLDLPVPRSSKIMISGTIVSDSAVNSGFISVRLSDSNSALTGSTKQYSTGKSVGGATVNVGFSVVGYTTLASGQEFKLEVAKDFAGTIVLDNALITIEPLW